MWLRDEESPAIVTVSAKSVPRVLGGSLGCRGTHEFSYRGHSQANLPYFAKDTGIFTLRVRAKSRKQSVELALKILRLVLGGAREEGLAVRFLATSPDTLLELIGPSEDSLEF